MATVASDTFTGTNGTALSSHTAESGGTWTERTGSFTLSSGKATCSGAALATLDSLSIGTPDYDVAADLTISDDVAAGVTGRHHATDNQFYYFRYLTDGFTGTNGTWQLYLFDGGATLLNDFSEAQTRGVSKRITLRLRGTTISGLVDGVEKVTATDSTITATGVAGMRNGGSAGTATLDNFAVDTPGGVAGTATVASGLTGTLTGLGALAASSAVTSGATATLTATGKLLSTCAVTSGTTGTLTAPGPLTATSAVTSGTTATLTATGKLLSNAVVASDTTGLLTSTGPLTATSAATSNATATLTATGKLLSTCAASSDTTGTLTEQAVFQGSSAATSNATATLTGLGLLLGTSASNCTLTVVLKGFGSLLGTSAITTNATGFLADASAPVMTARAARKMVVSAQDLPIRVATSAGQSRTFAAGSL